MYMTHLMLTNKQYKILQRNSTKSTYLELGHDFGHGGHQNVILEINTTCWKKIHNAHKIARTYQIIADSMPLNLDVRMMLGMGRSQNGVKKEHTCQQSKTERYFTTNVDGSPSALP